MSDFMLLLRISMRNIFSSFLNVIIGLIILVGTMVFVAGGSIISSIDQAMSQSIIGSVAGHAQFYQGSSKDTPSMFEGWQIPDLDAVPDFSRVKPALLRHPNVRMVVPMGVNTAIVAYGNTVDQALERLRTAVKPKSGVAKDKTQSLKSHVRQIVSLIQGDYAKLSSIADKKSVDTQASADLARASSAAFWNSFDADPLGHLEFLENHIASLVPDADQIFLSYVGTDIEEFQKGFDRLQIVDGQNVPPRQRGILIPKFVYEEQFKMKIAHRLDEIHEAITEKGKKLAGDKKFAEYIKQNRTQTRELILQLDPLSTKKAVASMQAVTGLKEMELGRLFDSFFSMDDSNFEARFKIFYAEVAPLVELYRVKPGDTLTIKAYTKSGFVQAVNVRVYGTFQFKGLEKSSLAGNVSVMDLMSFRDLYGYVTPDKVAETKRLQKEAGARYVARESAEADLFGGGSTVSTASQTRINDKAELGDRVFDQAGDLLKRVYTREEIEKGSVMEGAILLKDPSRLKSTLKDLQKISDDEKLGLKFVDWQKAAGLVGNFVLVCKAILYISTLIIFVVALVIINNAVVMATLQRVREIGTLRAIGAQKGFVLSMVLMETMTLGVAFGALGALLGAGAVFFLKGRGLAAPNEFFYFFFSGPKLYPELSFASLVGAFFVVLIVTCLSALYPAVMATRVSPIRAMASED